MDSPQTSPTASAWQSGDILLAALGFGLGAGAAEALIRVGRHQVFHSPYASSDLAWILPLADGMSFVTLGGLLLAASLLWRKLRSPTVVLALFGGLSVLAVVLLFPKIHPATGLVLASGVGIGIARLADRSAASLRRWLRR